MLKKIFAKVKKMIIQILREIVYRLYSYKYNKKPLNIEILDFEETLKERETKKSSLIRYGDGEILLMLGESIKFQKAERALSHRLLEILSEQNDNNLLICLPDIFESLEKYNVNSRKIWATHREHYYAIYKLLCESKTYGNSFISRPYYIFENRNNSRKNFEDLKKMWTDKEILIVEGVSSHSGVGNDLFSNSKSISRIICPSENAFSSYDEILFQIQKYGKDKLILLMLGPTATVLGYDLSKLGYEAIDLGHIDSEYEWFKMSAETKVRIPNKHTAEFSDADIEEYFDEQYEKQILIKLI